MHAHTRARTHTHTHNLPPPPPIRRNLKEKTKKHDYNLQENGSSRIITWECSMGIRTKIHSADKTFSKSVNGHTRVDGFINYEEQRNHTYAQQKI